LQIINWKDVSGSGHDLF